MNLAGSASLAGPSHLLTQVAPQLSLSVTPDAALSVSGITLAGPVGGKDVIRTVDVAEPGFYTWTGETTTVTAVPSRFFLTEAFGKDLAPNAGAKPGYKELQAALIPLTSWISGHDGIALDLTDAPLQTLASEIPNLITDPQAASAMTALLQKMSMLRSTPSSRTSYLLEGAVRDGVTCIFEDQASCS